MRIQNSLLVGLLAATNAFSQTASAQLFRTIDGTGNNTANAEYGAAGAQLRRMMPPDYADDVSAMPVRINPRVISNAVSVQSGGSFAPKKASAFLWQWGQFLDHDIDLTDTTDGESANIFVPPGEEYFPAAEGENFIPFQRSKYDIETGISAEHPRNQLNMITSFIDASNVYGSDNETAHSLRKFDGSGRLKTSPGRLLPLDVTGELFVAGDIRANEQIGLTSMHTLFVREHNRIARRIVEHNRAIAGNDEEIYQRARRIVGALMQKITYGEFLPLLLGSTAINPYSGYKPEIDPTIMNVFSTSAYRFGHSLLSPTLLRLNRKGREIPGGHVPLRLAFFAPQWIHDDGIEPILRGLAVQRSQNVDIMIVDDVRNFLFGNPAGAVGMDLASLNIQRGRDHGIPTYNKVRNAMGLSPASTWADLSTNPAVQDRLASVYASVDDIDAWVGGLAEDHVPGALVGELNFTIIKQQFESLRDGDRYWYQRTLPPRVLKAVENTTLKDVIVRNTRIRQHEIQSNVFRVGGRRPATGK